LTAESGTKAQLIVPVGTQVVTLVEVRGRAGA
jgi:hypothetical protein